MLIESLVPKILFHALLLSHIHKLEIWYRPEPRRSALSRQPTATENFLQSIFVQYIEYLIRNKYGSLTHSSGINREEPQSHCYSLLHLCITQQSTQEVLRLSVNTPQFYRQLITYGKLSDYLSYTLLHPYEENHTAWSNDSQRLIDIIRNCELDTDGQASGQRPRTRELLVNTICTVYIYLRCVQPVRGHYPDHGLPSTRENAKTQNSSRSLSVQDRPCFLDEFVRDNCGLLVQVQYMLATLSLQWRAWVMRFIGGE